MLNKSVSMNLSVSKFTTDVVRNLLKPIHKILDQHVEKLCLRALGVL